MAKASTPTAQSNPTLASALAGIGAPFGSRICDAYLDVKKRYLQAGRDPSMYDAVGLSAGKFAETLLRFAQQELTGAHIPFGTHIKNFPDECRKLINLASTSGAESLRILIPRALVLVMTLRGKRGIGHVGGDVEANEIDATAVVRLLDWIVCELVRLYHHLPLEEAQGIVDALTRREVPYVWTVAGRRRVLLPGLDFKDKTLVLAYSEPQGGVLVEDLFSWVEYSNLSVYKKAVLFPLHKAKLIEYDDTEGIVYISPLGERHVDKLMAAHAPS